jgi:lipoyl-dependent peroxiredoxin
VIAFQAPTHSRPAALGPGALWYHLRAGQGRPVWLVVPPSRAVKGDVIVATVRTATTRWEGPLATGKGSVSLDSSGLGSFELTWLSRAEAPNGRTSPEELIAAAHSGCFSMALSHGLSEAGHPPTSVTTSADVTFSPPEGISGIRLTTHAVVPGITAAEFAAVAEDAKKNCPVSRALTGTTIELSATLDE